MKPFSVTVQLDPGTSKNRRELYRTEAETHEEAKNKAAAAYHGQEFRIGLARDLTEQISKAEAERDRIQADVLRGYIRRTREGRTDDPTQDGLTAACRAGRAEYDAERAGMDHRNEGGAL